VPQIVGSYLGGYSSRFWGGVLGPQFGFGCESIEKGAWSRTKNETADEGDEHTVLPPGHLAYYYFYYSHLCRVTKRGTQRRRVTMYQINKKTKFEKN